MKNILKVIAVLVIGIIIGIGAVIIIQGKDKADNLSEKNTASVSESAEITEENAKMLALDKAGFTEEDVRFIKCEKDIDDGIKVFDIDFVKEDTEYSAEINSINGEIVSWETEKADVPFYKETVNKEEPQSDGISEADAIGTALEKANVKNAQNIRAHKDFEDGREVFEVEFYDNKTEYSVEVDAKSGEVVSFDMDND